mgnify:FL=1
MFAPLKSPAGVYRDGTNCPSLGRWCDANLVRWSAKTMRAVGGWVKSVDTQMSGPGRGMTAWRSTAGSRLCAIGVPDNLYVWDDDSITDITPAGFPSGKVDTFYGVGYGFGPYGAGPYGQTSGSGTKLDATTWTLDNFGQVLIACASHDGTIYEWTPGDPAAVAVANAPEARAIFVTQERIVVALGADGNARKVMWSNQEDREDWTADPLNQAGEILIQTTGNLLAGVRTRGENLLLTSTDAHTMRYLGPPYVYGFDRVGDNCGLISTLGVQPLEGGAAWMGFRNFYLFSGGVVRPLECDVHDYVFSDLNIAQAAKVCSGHVAQFGEIWWFYPSANSNVIDRYVVWNYRENHWSIGTLARSCWIDAGIFLKPLAVSEDGYLYEHESGWTDDGSDRLTSIFAKSGPVEVGTGDRIMMVRQRIPDELTPMSWQVRVATQFTPEGPAYDHGPYICEPYTDMLFSGRQVAVQFEAIQDIDIRLGICRFDGQPGARR